MKIWRINTYLLPVFDHFTSKPPLDCKCGFGTINCKPKLYVYTLMIITQLIIILYNTLTIKRKYKKCLQVGSTGPFKHSHFTTKNLLSIFKGKFTKNVLKQFISKRAEATASKFTIPALVLVGKVLLKSLQQGPLVGLA